MKQYRKILTIIILFATQQLTAQSIRLDNLRDQFGKGKPFKVNGALAANGIYYNGNGLTMRDPFSYFVNGSLNVNLYGLVNLPFSFTLSSFGKNYSYPIPRNRFSVHPSYKSITGHIGNISASYSPYTLNGYLFTGVGVDVAPEGGFKAGAIYGRLQKAVEYDSANQIIPAAYERMGYGTKLEYQVSNYRMGVVIFQAWDDANSLRNKPDSLQIFPVENTVVSFNAAAKVFEHMNLTVEYATSSFTEDMRAEDAKATNLLGKIIGHKESTAYTHAFKSSLQYTVSTTVLGVGYERIDPGYRTLGAYYLNNDLENITVNAAQPMFHSKVQVSVSAGYQRDNLNHAKSGSSSRIISSFNVSFTPSDKFTSAFNYSNFQTYMRIRPQFRTINQLDNFQNLDTLNYTQVSQNANASFSYTVAQTEEASRNINLDLSFQETADQQGDVIANGNLSQFYNASVMYSSSRITAGRNLSVGVNATYNTIGREDFITVGPIASMTTSFLHKKITTGANVSYNASQAIGVWDNHVFNVRVHGVYKMLKRHTLTLNILNQWRQSASRSANDMTMTLGYNFIL